MLNALKKHLQCGVVREQFKKPILTFCVSDFSDILNIVIPFFDKYLIKGDKSADYEDFRRVAFIMKDKIHFTAEGLNVILGIKAQMKSKTSILFK